MELILGAGVGKERRFPMKLEDGVYRVKAVPVPSLRRASGFSGGGPIRGRLGQRHGRGPGLCVGDKTVKLSKVRSLPGSKPQAVLDNKEKLDGNLADLEGLAVKVGKQSLRLDLATAVALKVDTPEESTGISCARGRANPARKSGGAAFRFTWRVSAGRRSSRSPKANSPSRRAVPPR